MTDRVTPGDSGGGRRDTTRRATTRRDGTGDRVAVWDRWTGTTVVQPWMAAAFLLLVAETVGGLIAVLLVGAALWLVVSGRRGGSGGRSDRLGPDPLIGPSS
jgi:hypothetical protein